MEFGILLYVAAVVVIWLAIGLSVFLEMIIFLHLIRNSHIKDVLTQPHLVGLMILLWPILLAGLTGGLIAFTVDKLLYVIGSVGCFLAKVYTYLLTQF